MSRLYDESQMYPGQHGTTYGGSATVILWGRIGTCESGKVDAKDYSGLRASFISEPTCEFFGANIVGLVQG